MDVAIKFSNDIIYVAMALTVINILHQDLIWITRSVNGC